MSLSYSIEAFKTWSPKGSVWSAWVKPVLFAEARWHSGCLLEIPELDFISAVDYKTAVIVDLPDAESVTVGLALARLGYRPVPLYNGVEGPGSAVVKVRDIVAALISGAEELSTLRIKDDAPPAFLLDANRMNVSGDLTGKYDNRWSVFPQDMPSAALLMSRGINKVIVCAGRVQTDLSHILLRYQERGIRVLLQSGNGLSEPRLLLPHRFRSIWYRMGVIAGLKRNSAGGFGGQIPDPEAGGSGRGYYGFG